MKRLAILGSTGSIGASTLAVVDLHPDRFEVVANPRSHRTVLFRAADIGGLYRITNVKKHSYRLIDQA